MPEHLPEPWVLVVGVIALLVGGLVAWWAHLRYWVARLTVEMPYASVESLPTPDGCRIELRHLPAGALEPHAPERPELPPLLLVHGVGANHRNNDMHPDASLARFLSAQGRDVWLLTLRSGLAERRRTEHRKVRFAAMAKFDVPTAVDAVLARTGAQSVDYVGFSMGGMLLYASLCRFVDESKVRRAVFIGSPGLVTRASGLVRLLRFFPTRFLPDLPLRILSRTWAFAIALVPGIFYRIISNPDNLRPELARAALVNVIEDIPAPLQSDFVRFAFTDGQLRVDEGEGPVLDTLADTVVPALFIAGAADRIAPPTHVRYAFERWGKRRPDLEKRFVLLGKTEGLHADYGHGDLAFGMHARDEVFAPVHSFLSS